MINKIILLINFISLINISNCFSSSLYNINIKKNNRNINNKISCRFQNDLSRRNFIPLIPIIINSPKNAFSITNNLNIKNVLVFGAGGYTGGDTIRKLLEENINVVAVTRRKVKIVEKKNSGMDTLVIDDINKIDKIKSINADVLKPETLNNIMSNIDCVIFCAASRPKVKITSTPGIKNNNIDYKENIAESSDNVEDIGLKNVALEAIKCNVKKLIIVSSICAKCQKGEQDWGEVVDKGFATCDACYKKQNGEEIVRELYEGSKLSYTIVRPGMLSPGELRGVENVEFNQGISKSGIISRLDLADVLVNAALTDNSDKKTFEVYYKDTAQPVDMYKSMQSCKKLGKSMKECFLGEGYDNDEKIDIDKLLKTPLKGIIFPSGNEVIGNNYSAMFKKLKTDKKELFDINILKSDNIL